MGGQGVGGGKIISGFTKKCEDFLTVPVKSRAGRQPKPNQQTTPLPKQKKGKDYFCLGDGAEGVGRAIGKIGAASASSKAKCHKKKRRGGQGEAIYRGLGNKSGKGGGGGGQVHRNGPFGVTLFIEQEGEEEESVSRKL